MDFLNKQIPIPPLLDLRLGVIYGTKDEFEVKHSYNAQQIEWFKAGAALNLIAKGL